MTNLVNLLKDASERFGPSTALTISMGIRQQRWSYRMLWDMSGRVAALLQGHGLVKGDRAIIWAPNRPEWAEAFFGCLRAGVVVVPLDVRSTPDFVARIIEQTEPKLAFLSHQTARDLQGSAFPQVPLEDLEELVESVIPIGDDVSIDGEDIAEIMFASGTTGDPKGVVLTHWNIASNVEAASQVITIKSSNKLLSLVPLSHMLEQTGGLLVPLSNGASVVYPVSRRPRVIFKTIRTNRTTNLVLVPQVLQIFMNAMEREARAKGKERQWRLLLRLAPLLPTRARRWLFRPCTASLGADSPW